MAGHPFRFLHTADWQMGMRAAGLGTAAEKVRQVRLDAAERVITVARDHQVDCIIIAGDVFEDNGVEPLLVQRVADILGRSPCPVFILPGNHDPLAAGTVYDREVWKRTPQVSVWRALEPYVFRPDVVLFPCPYLTRRPNGAQTAWIPPRGSGDESIRSIRVGIAHGTLLGLVASEDESAAPVDPEAAHRHDLDYLALGHWHSTFFYPAAPGCRTAYSGTHETTRFGERDSGNVLVVEIAGPGAPPRIDQVHTGRLTWRQEEREVGSPDDFEALLRGIDREDQDEARAALIELRLSGVVPAEIADRVDTDLRALVEARFLFARLVTEGLLLQPTEAEMLAIAPAGPVRATCERLLEAARNAGTERERAVARMALSELYAVSQEVTA